MLLVGLAGALVMPAHAGPAAPPKTPATPAPRVKTVTFGIRHRVFPDFGQKLTVGLREPFAVGYSEYSAEAVRFLPDFDYDIKKHKAVSRSNDPRNPAFQIITRKDGVVQDTSWAFLNSPPHFGRRSMLAYQVLRIEFENHAAVVADTSAAKAAP